MKDNGRQYRTRVSAVTKFMQDDLGLQPDRIWPLSIRNTMRFFSHLQLQELSASTITGYWAAIQWFHDISGFPSLASDPQFQQLHRLLEACFRVNHVLAKGKREIPSDLLELISQEVMSKSTSFGDHYHRDATIFTTLGHTGARGSEVRTMTTARVKFMQDRIRFTLDYESSKTTRLSHSRTAKRHPSDFFDLVATGLINCPCKFFTNWWNISGCHIPGPDRPVFPNSNSKKPISYSTIRLRLLATLTKMGYNASNYGTHSFRHGRAHDMQRAGAPLSDIRKVLRHAPDSNSTHLYLPQRDKRTHTTLDVIPTRKRTRGLQPKSY